jgi:Carboxypeptidase regulatory-like domain
MRSHKLCLAIVSFLFIPALTSAGPKGGSITGKVILKGNPAKPELINMSKEPECVKLNPKPPLTEDTITGPNNGLKNVVVYISAGAPNVSSPPLSPVFLDQRSCHYSTRVLAFQVGQEVKISNSDPLSHNIHPMAVTNREWNRIQLPGTPPFSYSYENPEFIPVKCNIHPWMRGYFAVLRNGHFAVTEEDGRFALPDLPPGKYSVSAWHETYGTLNQEITVLDGQPLTIDFVYNTRPK